MKLILVLAPWPAQGHVASDLTVSRRLQDGLAEKACTTCLYLPFWTHLPPKNPDSSLESHVVVPQSL